MARTQPVCIPYMLPCDFVSLCFPGSYDLEKYHPPTTYFKMPNFVLKYLGTLIIALALGAAHAQVPTEAALLWKIEGRDLPKPSYLYGTIHLICPGDFVLSDTLKGCFKETDRLTLEIDMDDPGLMMAMARSMSCLLYTSRCV